MIVSSCPYFVFNIWYYLDKTTLWGFFRNFLQESISLTYLCTSLTTKIWCPLSPVQYRVSYFSWTPEDFRVSHMSPANWMIAYEWRLIMPIQSLYLATTQLPALDVFNSDSQLWELRVAANHPLCIPMISDVGCWRIHRYSEFIYSFICRWRSGH